MRCLFALLAILLAGFLLSDLHAGDAIKIANLEKLNTEADEEDPCPTPDGNAIMYAGKGKDGYDIFISRRTTPKDPFPAGKPLYADKETDERCPIYYKDRMYYAANEVRDPKFAKLRNFDLMMRIGTQAPLFVQDVNSAADEMYPWITPAGKELYFSRKTEDGWKLFVANGPTPGPVGKATDVGFPAGFHRATVAGPGLVMYLQGPLDDGKIGIFRSRRGKISEKWSKPEPVKALNHAESKKGDLQPALNAEGTRLYFVSDRPNGKGGLDIWTVLTSQLK